MQLFVDSADEGEIAAAASWGFVDGVTTNPTSIAARGVSMAEALAAIVKLIDGPISAECMQTEATAIVAEGKRLAALHRNIVVKVPLTHHGLRAVRKLADQNIRTNVTLCFTAAQGLLAAKAGATYVSPFIGRLDDVAYDGMQLVRELCQIVTTFHFPTSVLAASIRHPRQVVAAALAGAHAATVPFKVLQQLMIHPLTELGVMRFAQDWKRSFGDVGAGG